MEKDTLADSSLSAFFDVVIRICGYFRVADIRLIPAFLLIFYSFYNSEKSTCFPSLQIRSRS